MDEKPSVTRSPGEIALLAVMTLGPAGFVAGDMLLYERTAFVLGAPAIVAGFLVLLGVWESAGGGAEERGKPTGGALGAWPFSARQATYVIATVLALIVFGPRLVLPAFGIVFARASGGGWLAAALTGGLCAALVEFVLIRALGHQLPLLAVLHSIGM